MPNTTVALYRSGNTTSPRLDNVRDVDVEYADVAKTQVLGRRRGISTFSNPNLLHGHVWVLAAGSPVDADLHLQQDGGGPHWSWQPDRTMAKTTFAAALGRQQAGWTYWAKLQLDTGQVDQEMAALIADAKKVASQPMPLTDKPHALLLDALDGQLTAMRERLAQVGDDEDSAADLYNDLALLRLTYAQITAHGPLPG